MKKAKTLKQTIKTSLGYIWFLMLGLYLVMFVSGDGGLFVISLVVGLGIIASILAIGIDCFAYWIKKKMAKR